MKIRCPKCDRELNTRDLNDVFWVTDCPVHGRFYSLKPMPKEDEK